MDQNFHQKSIKKGGIISKPAKTIFAILGAFILVTAYIMMKNSRKTSPIQESVQEISPSPITGSLSVGDLIRFGSYEQDNDLDNGKEAIEWQVLAVEENRVLVISKYALDVKPFNYEYRRVTWETSYLRNWLNGEFMNNAFSPTERAQILTVINKNPDNPVSRIKGGKDTKDQIFLLSIDEADKYLNTDATRQCQSTEYAKANGDFINEYNGESWWWLRSRGSTSKTASLVLYSGYINTVGFGVNNNFGDVRPSFWLSL